MITARCPTCSKGIQIATIDDLPSFPFCSERCRLIDLGRWIDERHAIPAAKLGEKPPGEMSEGTIPPADEDDADA